MQFSVLNGVKSEPLPVRVTNNLPSTVSSGFLLKYANNTTIFCIGQSADLAIALLNKALQEVYRWCLANQLTPHPGKSEVTGMLLCKKDIIGRLPPPDAPRKRGLALRHKNPSARNDCR